MDGSRKQTVDRAGLRTIQFSLRYSWGSFAKSMKETFDGRPTYYFDRVIDSMCWLDGKPF